MEIAYLHLVTNHIPIIGVPFGLAILFLGIWRNSSEIKAVSFLFFVFLGLATTGVYFLGQGGEDFVEELAAVSHDAIEDHEGAATFALASVLVLAAVSAFTLIRHGGLNLLRPRFRKAANENNETGAAAAERQFPVWAVTLVVIISLFSSGVLGYTGRLGGKIRHTEFHQGTASANDPERDQNEEADGENEGGRRRGRNRGGR